jgi:hypothetical protein
MSDLIDSVRGNNITKVVQLLDLLKKQLDRMESKIDAIEDVIWADR